MPTIPLNLIAFLSELVLFEWRKGVPCRHLGPRRRLSHTARGRRPEAEFSVNENSFFYTLLGCVLIVLAALYSINRAVFRRFHRHSSGGFRARVEARLSRAAIDF